MLRKLKSPAVAGGIGSLIVTLVIFFAEGGFKNMNPWYIVGLVVGIGLIVYGLVTNNSNLIGVKTRAKERLRINGGSESISPEDANLILVMSIELDSIHGYNDLTGLFADRASGVPLNELKTRPCSQCGIPRNQRGKHHE
jgi:hypothetical protein